MNYEMAIVCALFLIAASSVFGVLMFATYALSQFRHQYEMEEKMDKLILQIKDCYWS